MTGFTESLRRQTQVRVEEGVTGYSFRPNPNNPGDEIAKNCGVSLIQEFDRKIEANTTRNRDFLKAESHYITKNVGQNPIICVVKKNVTPLKNLLSWVTSFGNKLDSNGIRYFSDVPLLVIDDESDVGSIDTNRGAVDRLGDIDENHNPTKINKQIRKLLNLFEQSSYVGYTATPFANVLIHDLVTSGIDTKDKLKIGEDLFPRSFIVSLPTPSNHVGPSMIFGTTDEDNEKKFRVFP